MLYKRTCEHSAIVIHFSVLKGNRFTFQKMARVNLLAFHSVVLLLYFAVLDFTGVNVS